MMIDFQGVYTALVTPMLEDGQIDWPTLTRLVEEQIAAGIAGLVPVGTTGESPTLDYEEHIGVIRHVVETAQGRVPVIAGAGANSTHEAVMLTQRADEVGADAFLHVAPYYNKPSQTGLRRHFAQIAKATDKPIVLYSIPGRCGIEIAVETVAALREEFSNVCVVKEAGGKAERVAAILDATGGGVTVLSGDDPLTLPFMSLGAKGLISVLTNLLPKEVIKVVDLALGNDFQAARRAHAPLFRLGSSLLSLGPNPAPVKEAMALLGNLPTGTLRLPLAPLDPPERARLETLLQPWLNR